MNRRFFCLGLGTGIVFMALAFFILYNVHISKIVVSTMNNNTEITNTDENIVAEDENLAKIEIAKNQVANVNNTIINETNEVETNEVETNEVETNEVEINPVITVENNELVDMANTITDKPIVETKETENIVPTKTAIITTEKPIVATEIIVKQTEKIVQKATEKTIIVEATKAPVVETNTPEPPKMTEYKTGENVYLIPEKTNNKTVNVNIPSGSSAKDVANKLKEAGIIEDAESFRKYLADNNIADSVRAGNFTINENSDFKAVADALTN